MIKELSPSLSPSPQGREVKWDQDGREKSVKVRFNYFNFLDTGLRQYDDLDGAF
jgi:hypothetical protein